MSSARKKILKTNADPFNEIFPEAKKIEYFLKVRMRERIESLFIVQNYGCPPHLVPLCVVQNVVKSPRVLSNVPVRDESLLHRVNQIINYRIESSCKYPAQEFVWAFQKSDRPSIL